MLCFAIRPNTVTAKAIILCGRLSHDACCPYSTFSGYINFFIILLLYITTTSYLTINLLFHLILSYYFILFFLLFLSYIVLFSCTPAVWQLWLNEYVILCVVRILNWLRPPNTAVNSYRTIVVYYRLERFPIRRISPVIRWSFLSNLLTAVAVLVTLPSWRIRRISASRGLSRHCSAALLRVLGLSLHARFNSANQQMPAHLHHFVYYYELRRLAAVRFWPYSLHVALFIC